MLQSRPVIHLVDQDSLTRNDLASVLADVGYAVSVYDDAESFLNRLPRDHMSPQCIVLDVFLPGMSGLGLQQTLRNLNVTTPLLFVSSHVDIGTVVEAIKTGAFDFLEKPIHQQILVRRVQEALDLDSAAVREREQQQRFLDRMRKLSRRECDVFELLISGRSTKEISRSLKVGLQTVAKHRARVLQKLEARSVVELVRRIARTSPAKLQMREEFPSDTSAS